MLIGLMCNFVFLYGQFMDNGIFNLSYLHRNWKINNWSWRFSCNSRAKCSILSMITEQE